MSVHHRDDFFSRKRTQAAFTLIELIAVIVILSIIATIGTTFAIRVADAYESTQNRALLVNTARPSLEQMMRQLRGALPFSVRIVNNDNCVEFLPIVAGGRYLDMVPDANNLAPLKGTISVSPHTVTFGSARFVAIGAGSPAELYGNTAVSRAGYGNASTPTQLVLDANKRWQRNSTNRRFYLLDNPQAFCVIAGELRFYENINIARVDVDLTAPSSLMARNVVFATQPFALAAGSENRQMMVNIALTFASGRESILFNQGVMIRNAP